MTWVAWRHARQPALVAAVALVIVVLILAVTGPQLVHDFRSDGLASCAAGQESTTDRTCGDLAQTFLGKLSIVTAVGSVLVLLPAIVGMFWGAPLVAREYENGTHRLAWTQSVTRTRWLAVKLAVVAAIALVATAVLSLAYTWWSQPRDHLHGLISPGLFTQRGVAPVAYVAFALALGVLVGVITRRVLPAMALTLILVQVTVFSVGRWVRPHLVEPTEVSAPTYTFFADDPPARIEIERGWVLTNNTVDRNGRVLSPAGEISDVRAAKVCDIPLSQLEGEGERRKRLLDDCGERLGLVDVAKMHTVDHFWPLQAAESALYAITSGVLVALSFWRVRRDHG